MSGPRIYTEAELVIGQTYPLNENNFSHLIRVLRMNENDSIRVFNGSAFEYAATLVQVQKKSASFTITEILREETSTPLHLHLGQVISKGDRMDFTIQKATELGIAEITPLTSERCDVRLKGDRQDKKIEHWQKIAISACQQSGRNSVPIIHPVQTLDEWLETRNEQVKLVLHPHQQQPLNEYKQPNSVALLVGPEGGFSETEVERTLAQEFDGLKLGPRILRTETAALVALSVLQFQWGDL